MKDEALRLALEALEYPGPSWIEARQPAITAIKQALEQSVADSNTLKEPVAKIEKQQHDPVAWTDIDFTDIYISELVAKEKNANVPLYTSQLKHDIEAVANWMIDRSYATGHGDTIADLLKELEWQIRENEREACAQLCEDLWEDDGTAWDCAVAIESRGNK